MILKTIQPTEEAGRKAFHGIKTKSTYPIKCKCLIFQNLNFREPALCFQYMKIE